ncbi:hypothetical protein [uncultured Halovibrio sp.]|uniref:hypothetical protein n=1 Tax=uncultured Halovibrio sp. TaxID=985049 RepID=UPI0025D4C7D3|nr:hypothetical protein [uncultured Halovibrio sp.]
MEPQLKKKLLLRKFSSIEYMEEFRDYHYRALAAMEEGIEYFYKHPPGENWHQWHRSEWPETWEERAVKNFKGMQKSIDEGIQKAQKDNFSSIRSAAGSFNGISKDMDVMGEKWWGYIPPEFRERFVNNLSAAKQRASNIWRTLGDYWKTPDSVLKETVTGPIDEKDLMRFLEPGETT